MKGRVLIVAGSDSGGGAGIQADIKAVTALGGFAATALTALTGSILIGGIVGLQGRRPRQVAAPQFHGLLVPHRLRTQERQRRSVLLSIGQFVRAPLRLSVEAALPPPAYQALRPMHLWIQLPWPLPLASS
mgnify:CR=1 FL=1